jgi:putative ABC transport system permease protein
LARLAPEIPRVAEVRIGMQDIGYVLAAAAFVSLLCGLIPAIRSIRGEQSLSGIARTQFAPRHSIQWILVGVQVALAVTLLAGAGVLLRSFDALSRVQPGFEPSGVLAFRVTGRWTESYNYDRVIQRINAWLDDLATLPGATSTATARWLPGVLSEAPPPVEFVQVGGAANDAMVAEGRSVDPRYFETMRIPLVSGQLCRKPSDNSMRLAKVEAMVNRAFAEQYFPGRQVLGVDLAGTAPQGFAPSETVAVVGVVENARESGLERTPVPTVYACDSAPNPFPWFLVRTAGSAETLAGIVRLKIHELQPLESVYDIAVLDRRIGEDYAQNRMRTWLLVIFASTALSLACVGVYGTLSYVVSQRRREVGLRVALGARSSSILAQFLAKVLRIVFLGCVAGLAIAFASARLFSGILYGVSSTDPMTFSAVTLLVIAVATLAALVPAIRAASVEPMRVLRDD